MAKVERKKKTGGRASKEKTIVTQDGKRMVQDIFCDFEFCAYSDTPIDGVIRASPYNNITRC